MFVYSVYILYFRHEERKNTMLSLMKLTREGTFDLWDAHFKSILLILLETLGDDDVSIKRPVDCIHLAASTTLSGGRKE
mgnify:FL=1